jgi:hypothetical protein
MRTTLNASATKQPSTAAAAAAIVIHQLRRRVSCTAKEACDGKPNRFRRWCHCTANGCAARLSDSATECGAATLHGRPSRGLDQLQHGAKPPTRVVKALKVDITASYSDDGVLPKLRSAGVFLPPP